MTVWYIQIRLYLCSSRNSWTFEKIWNSHYWLRTHRSSTGLGYYQCTVFLQWREREMHAIARRSWKSIVIKCLNSEPTVGQETKRDRHEWIDYSKRNVTCFICKYLEWTRKVIQWFNLLYSCTLCSISNFPTWHTWMVELPAHLESSRMPSSNVSCHQCEVNHRTTRKRLSTKECIESRELSTL